MENANATLKRIDKMLFKEFKNIIKKDENVAAVFSICIKHFNKARNRYLIKHFNKARNRYLEFPLNNF